MPNANITAKQLAQAVGTDAKTLRRFLRSYLRENDLETPGQGGRYAFTKREAKGLAVAFKAAHAPKPPKELNLDEELSDEEFELTDEDLNLDIDLSADEDEDEESEDENEDENEDDEPEEQEEDTVADELEEIDVETL